MGRSRRSLNLLQVLVVLQLVHQLAVQVVADLLRSALRGRQGDVTAGRPIDGQPSGDTHEGQRSLVDVAAGPGVPVDLRGRPGDDAAAALTLRRLEGCHLGLDQ